jgi:hypothetical protein
MTAEVNYLAAQAVVRPEHWTSQQKLSNPSTLAEETKDLSRSVKRSDPLLTGMRWASTARANIMRGDPIRSASARNNAEESRDEAAGLQQNH